MTRFKDFGAGKAGITEPVTFKLHDQEFEALPEVPGKLLLDLVDADSETGSGGATIVREFFSRVLTDESYARFDALLDSKDKITTMDTLAEIVAWLMEEYTNRPEKQPED